ncbi:MAG TPA: 30S ribosome-binding factor RbfA [Candidatus Heimdallarchaeota archaeon]|nr:30S ribosome-binding factor RbfA [Candidatus Heimdallarchaeota archaeon]
MEESRRQKKVSSLIKEVLSQILIDTVRDTFESSLITITRLEITKDLKTAHVYLSLFGKEQEEQILEVLNERMGYFRKHIASRTNLKYNPMLIFSYDPILSYEEKIDALLEKLKKDERSG